jgi:NAD(P)-dependent dehydrogenase (short-subunit alcohol dehydrogenase family)
MSGRLVGKVALVTGAAGGLGAAITSRLREEGARVAVADLGGEGLFRAAELADEDADVVAAFPVDLRVADEVTGLPAQVVDRFGSLDILVNNAGVRSVYGLLEHPLAAWQQTLDVNLTAPFLLIQAAVPHMLERGGGHIVNITSTTAVLGLKNRAAYNVSKAGLSMLTKSVALELGGRGIRCNAVAPGVVETPLNSHYFQDEAFAELIVTNTPNGSWGQPADIAAAVAFLCAEEANFVNGAVLLVDGGWSTGKGY